MGHASDVLSCAWIKVDQRSILCVRVPSKVRQRIDQPEMHRARDGLVKMSRSPRIPRSPDPHLAGIGTIHPQEAHSATGLVMP